MKYFVFLYGPPAVGKSTIGHLLAEALDMPFLDLDLEIESRAGRPIPEIFENQGEAGFRAREKTRLEAVLTGEDCIVALGGGALLDPQNRAWVEAAGHVLCLNAPAQTLAARLPEDPSQRPLLAGDALESLQELLRLRHEHYASFTLQLDTKTSPPEQVAWQAQVLLGRFHVRGMGSGYDVLVQCGSLNHLGEALKREGLNGPVALVSDQNVGSLYASRVVDSLHASGYVVHRVFIPPGETHKNMLTVSRLWDEFLDAKLERGSPVVALGGGVVGDLAGFAAATFLRGVPWVAVPTSLLAMIDASMGGKTGADLPQGKNLVGAFHPPKLVWTDPLCLKTLPDVELRSGLAEVVKHGVIGDPELFDLCAGSRLGMQDDWENIVRKAAAVKVRVIQEDPFEKGIRQALNFGHTIGHAVEFTSGYQVRHGEAVAIGMVSEARLAARLQIAQAELAGTLATALAGLGLPTEIPAALRNMDLVKAMQVDKKRAGGVVRFALPVQIGKVRVGVEVNELHSFVSELRG